MDIFRGPIPSGTPVVIGYRDNQTMYYLVKSDDGTQAYYKSSPATDVYANLLVFTLNGNAEKGIVLTGHKAGQGSINVDANNNIVLSSSAATLTVSQAKVDAPSGEILSAVEYDVTYNNKNVIIPLNSVIPQTRTCKQQTITVPTALTKPPIPSPKQSQTNTTSQPTTPAQPATTSHEMVFLPVPTFACTAKGAQKFESSSVDLLTSIIFCQIDGTQDFCSSFSDFTMYTLDDKLCAPDGRFYNYCAAGTPCGDCLGVCKEGVLHECVYNSSGQLGCQVSQENVKNWFKRHQWWVIGIAAGVLVLIVMVGAVIYFLIKRKNKD